MQANPTQASLLPVFDIGAPASGAPPDDGAEGPGFNELLAPPPTCPPPPREDPSLKSDAPLPADASASQRDADRTDPPAEAPAAKSDQPAGPPAAQDTTVNQPETKDDKPAPEAKDETVAESLAALAAVPLPQTQSQPAAESVAVETPAPAVEPAAKPPVVGDHPAATPVPGVIAANAVADQEKATQKPAQNDAAPAEAAAAKVAVKQVAAAIDESKGESQVPGTAERSTADSPASGLVEVQPAGEQHSESDRGNAEPKPEAAAATLSSDGQVPIDQQLAAKTSESAPPPVAAPEVKSTSNDAARVTNPQAPSVGAINSPPPRSRLPAAFVTREPASTQPSPQIDSVRLINRVARAFAAAQQRDGDVQLRLSPPELGSLRLLVQVHEGALTARLEAETPAARTALIDNLPVLRDRLAEQGVRIERFDVDLMQRQPGGMPNQPQDRQQPETPQPRTPPAGRLTTSPLPARTQLPRTAGSSQLNVIV